MDGLVEDQNGDRNVVEGKIPKFSFYFYCNKAMQTFMPSQKKNNCQMFGGGEEEGKKIPNLIHEGSRLTSARSRIKSRFLLSFGSGGLNLRFSAFCSPEPKSSNAGLPGSLGLVMQLSSPLQRLFLPASDFLVLP